MGKDLFLCGATYVCVALQYELFCACDCDRIYALIQVFHRLSRYFFELNHLRNQQANNIHRTKLCNTYEFSFSVFLCHRKR